MQHLLSLADSEKDCTTLRRDQGRDAMLYHPMLRWASFRIIQADRESMSACRAKKKAARRDGERPLPSISRSSFSGAAVTKQLAWGRASALVLSEGLLAIDNDRPVSLGSLYATPLATREVMRDLTHPVRLDIETV
jgi:hypothetical protein